jgi:hypothetical protein
VLFRENYATMTYRIEDLGVAGMGETSLDHGFGLLARHPKTNEEYAIHPTMEHGFVAVNPVRKTSVHVYPDRSRYERTSRGAAQAPDGCLYHLGFAKGPHGTRPAHWSLLRWDWENPVSQPVQDWELPADTGAQPEFDREGRLYLPSAGNLCQLDLRTRRSEIVAHDAGPARCGHRDGLIYFVSNSAVCCFDPRTRSQTRVLLPGGLSCSPRALEKDGQGRVLLPIVTHEKSGRAFWLELLDGKAIPVDASAVQLAQTLTTHLEVAQADPSMTYFTPYAFRDGSYLSRIVGREATYVDSAGRPITFPLQMQDSPLQLYALETGGGRIWLGTVCPLYLLSYDPQTGIFDNHGNVSPAIGEIYNLVWSDGRLFMAGYPGAHISRFGLDFGPDGHLYFLNGAHLMRMRWD